MIGPGFLLLAAACLMVPSARVRTRLRTVSRESHGNIQRSVRPGETRSRLPLLMALASGFWIAVLVRFPLGAFVGAGAGWGIHWVWARRSRTEGESRSHPLLLAAGWDLLAAGMRVGLPPAVILRAVAAEFTGVTAKILYEVAALHEWGADPVSAWEPALRHPDTAELARAARRSARTGSGIAELATDVAAAARAAVKEQTGKHAERAGVWVSAPLGLCFLPAFLCLGVLPVVLGMLQRLNFS